MISSMGSYGAVANSYFINSSLRNAADSSSVSNSSANTSGTDEADEVSFSETAQLLMSMMGTQGRGGMMGMRAPQGPPPEGEPGERMNQAIEEKQLSFDAELKAKIESAGIDTEQEIELAYDDAGDIVVTSDVSAEDKALIESILAEDSELSARYQELTDMKAMAAEMEEMFAQRPPIQGMMSMGANRSNVASAYANNSNLTSNSSVSTLLQQLTQTLGS